jgi:hypothetical protein
MKIASTSVAMQSQHFTMQRTERTERLRSWTAPPMPTPRAAAAAASSSNAGPSEDASASGDVRLQLLKAVLEWLTGKPVKLLDTRQLQAPDSAAASAEPAPHADSAPPAPNGATGLTYQVHILRQEVERTDFAAQGTITTVDGRQIAFAVDISMSRSFSEQTDVNVRAGNARQQDPLVLNLGGAAAQLSTERMNFDLNGDGKAESVPMLAGGGAYLALDRNQDGKIGSGTELFGPTTGSGFAELAQYDSDGNGWIDENDPVFKQLRTWQPAADGGGRLATLADGKIGALFLGHQATVFQLRDMNNQELGTVRSSGVYLTESGQAGGLQQIDLTA